MFEHLMIMISSVHTLCLQYKYNLSLFPIDELVLHIFYFTLRHNTNLSCTKKKSKLSLLLKCYGTRCVLH